MLYVFHVDAGLMTTYDMSLTLQSVSCLKSAIERKTKIPWSSLVLLVSGGEVLQSDHMVSSYSAGTDTNPIYMFSKPSVKDSNLKQSSQYSVCDLTPMGELNMEYWRSDSRSGVEGKSVAELKSAVESCNALPPALSTVSKCATLAQQFSELAHDVARSSEQLIHDQHLQHQGWSAVVANLDDIFNEFCERSVNFKECNKKHRLKKDQYRQQLQALEEVLESLGKIPILEALRSNAEEHRFSAFDISDEMEMEGPLVSAPMEDSYQTNKGYQDFGVEALKMSEEDVFDNQKDRSSLQDDSIPIQSSSEDAHRDIQESDEGVTFKAQSYDGKADPTLLHWILAKGNKASLQDILDYCQKGLILIDEDPLKEREVELLKLFEYANLRGLKQIKGIEDRLYGLDQLLNEIKKLERDQHDQAASLLQNRERVSVNCDPSVLPTLVQSHRCQLEKLLKNHQLMVDIRRRVSKSKDELSHILHARLDTVLRIENSMSVLDAHQMLSFQCFNRLARYFDIVEQLHRAPNMFVRAVHEVARRRDFSDAFLVWASELASNLRRIHDAEVSRRQEFNALFHGHFLTALFPGMWELPPPFGTQAPSLFDAKLPRLTAEDARFVTACFPEMSAEVPPADMEGARRFFSRRFGAIDSPENDAAVQVELNIEYDSETVAGDFERLSRQSTTEKQKVDMSTICVPDTNSVSMVTEVRSLAAIPEGDETRRGEFVHSEFYIEESYPSSMEWGRDEQENMDTERTSIEKLNDFLNQLFEICKVNVICIRNELATLRNEVNNQRRFLSSHCLELLQAWEKSNEETALSFREQTQRLTVDHELELSDLKNVVIKKDEYIETLNSEKDDIKAEHQREIERLQKEHDNTKEILENTRHEMQSFDKKIEEAESLKQKEIKELQDKMHMDYKAEIESLRSRFRLVALTNMDRSPSESSLEKIERTDVIEISSHNAIVMQTKENAELEREAAVKEALERCERDWSVKMDETVAALKAKYEAEKQVTVNEVTRRLLSEKDRQLELLRERETNLMRECTKYKETIQQLTDPETNDYDSLLKSQLATMENEKAVMQRQIQDLKKELERKAEDTDNSRASDSDGRSWEEVRKQRTRCHSPYGLVSGTLSLSSCLPGHTVLVLWDPSHQNYTVFQEEVIMYFVHSDCLPALDLSITVKNERDRKLYATAIVESKEYCYAKKSGNRYHMLRGSRFYRVRVKPYRTHWPVPPCCDHRHRPQDCMNSGSMAVFREQRPVKKWLTYMHAPDGHKTSSDSDDSRRKEMEVATATLINLESPAGEAGAAGVVIGAPDAGEAASLDQPDSMDSSEWTAAAGRDESVCFSNDMECSVDNVVPGALTREPLELPTELSVSLMSVYTTSDGQAPIDSEVAEEATP